MDYVDPKQKKAMDRFIRVFGDRINCQLQLAMDKI